MLTFCIFFLLSSRNTLWSAHAECLEEKDNGFCVYAISMHINCSLALVRYEKEIFEKTDIIFVCLLMDVFLGNA